MDKYYHWVETEAHNPKGKDDDGDKKREFFAELRREVRVDFGSILDESVEIGINLDRNGADGSYYVNYWKEEHERAKAAVGVEELQNFQLQNVRENITHPYPIDEASQIKGTTNTITSGTSLQIVPQMSAQPQTAVTETTPSLPTFSHADDEDSAEPISAIM